MKIIQLKNKRFSILTDEDKVVIANIEEDEMIAIYSPRTNRPRKCVKTFDARLSVFGLDVKTEMNAVKVAYSEFCNQLTFNEDSTENLEPLEEPTISFEEALAEYNHQYELEVYACIMAQNKNVSNPAWLAVVAPPSSGKSYDLKVCTSDTYALSIDSMSENALAAATPNADAEQSEDVFSRGTNMTHIYNDMGSMLGDNNDKVRKFIGYYTTAFGGDFNRAGPTEIRRYDTHIAVIMGMTPQIYYGNLNHFSSFGQRFLTLKYFVEEADCEEIFDDDLVVAADHSEMRKNIAAALERSWDITLPEEVGNKLKDMVLKVVLLRSFFFAKTRHDLERPHRLFNQLKNLMRSRARLHDRSEITMDDLDFVKPLVWHSIPNDTFLFNIMDKGVEMEGLSRLYQDALRNGVRVGLLECTEYLKSGAEYTTMLYSLKTNWDIFEEYHQFLIKMGYTFDQTIGKGPKKLF